MVWRGRKSDANPIVELLSEIIEDDVVEKKLRLAGSTATPPSGMVGVVRQLRSSRRRRIRLNITEYKLN